MTRDRFARTVLAPIAVVAVAFGAGAFIARRDIEHTRCVQVAPSSDGCDGNTATVCEAMTRWEYERVDDNVGQWYAPGDILQGWATNEDGAVWPSRVCAETNG